MKSLSLSTGVREGPSTDESLLPSFTITIPPSVQATKPPRLGQGHQHLLLLPPAPEAHSKLIPLPYLSHPRLMPCPQPQPHTASLPHLAINTAITCQSYVNTTPGHHQLHTEPLSLKTARAENGQQTCRGGPVLAPASFLCGPWESHSPSLGTNSGICKTQDSDQLFSKSLPSCESLQRIYSEAVRKVSHCTLLTPMPTSTKKNPFLSNRAMRWDSKRCCFASNAAKELSWIPQIHRYPSSFVSLTLFSRVFLPVQLFLNLYVLCFCLHGTMVFPWCPSALLSFWVCVISSGLESQDRENARGDATRPHRDIVASPSIPPEPTRAWTPPARRLSSRAHRRQCRGSLRVNQTQSMCFCSLPITDEESKGKGSKMVQDRKRPHQAQKPERLQSGPCHLLCPRGCFLSSPPPGIRVPRTHVRMRT